MACTAWSPKPCKSDGTCASADVVPPRGEDLPGKEEVEQLPAWVRVADVVFDDHFRSLETATGDGAACSNNAPDAVMDACPGDLVRFDARGRGSSTTRGRTRTRSSWPAPAAHPWPA